MIEKLDIERLSIATQTLYAELTSQLSVLQLEHRNEYPPGVLTKKEVRGNTYWYIQYSEAGTRRQVYLGADREIGDQLEALRQSWEHRENDMERTSELTAMLRSSGMHTPDATTGRVLEVLGQQGIFDVGTVLVGSLAFMAFEGLLGVRWGSAFRTADIDVAASRSVALAVPGKADLLAALEQTQLPFDEIPALDPRKPSTSFRLRGKELRVDVLVPEVGKPSEGPIQIPRLGVAAQPLRFLDYLVADASPATLIARSGVLINVPQPARYALHKLLIATRRPVTAHPKVAKDLLQASQLIAVLLEDRPGDLEVAWSDLRDRGKGWRNPVRKMARRIDDDLFDALVSEVPELAS